MLQETLWETEKILLVGVLWDMSIFKPKLENKRISVEISFGNMTYEGEICSEPVPIFTSSRILVYSSDFRN
jgi:hypothetical protein